MLWGIFSFLGANERFVDSKKNIPCKYEVKEVGSSIDF
jgi:hypothetical protein